MSQNLAQLTGQPELTVSIGGREYHFSELPVEALGRLQAFINQAVPHPVDALKGHLDGLPAEDRRFLLEQARIEGQKWPPQIGTAAGAAALLGSEAGQVEALWEGLRVHHSPITPEQARAVYRALGKDTAREAKRSKAEGRDYDGEGQAKRIFACLFGMADADRDDPALKG